MKIENIKVGVEDIKDINSHNLIAEAVSNFYEKQEKELELMKEAGINLDNFEITVPKIEKGDNGNYFITTEIIPKEGKENE